MKIASVCENHNMKTAAKNMIPTDMLVVNVRVVGMLAIAVSVVKTFQFNIFLGIFAFLLAEIIM